MNSENVLIFDVGSEYGHFRKYNTTTSPLTYSFPPRTAVIGLIGSILGIEREVASGVYQNPKRIVSDLFSRERLQVAVQVIHPVKKVNMAFNLLDTEKAAASFFNIKQRTQIEFELLKNPLFRIFLCFENQEMEAALGNRLKTNQSFFTPYLGLSQFTATTQYIALVKRSKVIQEDFVDVISAINTKKTDYEFDFDYSANFKYTSDTMPIELSKERIVQEYAEVIVENAGKPIRVKSSHVYHAEGHGNIIFL